MSTRKVVRDRLNARGFRVTDEARPGFHVGKVHRRPYAVKVTSTTTGWTVSAQEKNASYLEQAALMLEESGFRVVRRGPSRLSSAHLIVTRG